MPHFVVLLVRAGTGVTVDLDYTFNDVFLCLQKTTRVIVSSSRLLTVS